MLQIATRRTPFRASTMCRLAMAVIAVLAAGGLSAGTATASGGKTWVVRPGQSIQAAVNTASSGDKIKINAGSYQEAVCVDHKGLTITGAGTGETKIVWPSWNTIAELPPVAATPCWTAQENADAEDDPSTLADDVSGLFFLFPDSPVKVTGLSTRNHPASGIIAWGADGFDVRDTKGVGHERYGVVAAASTKISIKDNSEKGVTRAAPVYSGTGGVSVGDSGGADATISGNRVEGYNLGIFLRELFTPMTEAVMSALL